MTAFGHLIQLKRPPGAKGTWSRALHAIYFHSGTRLNDDKARHACNPSLTGHDTVHNVKPVLLARYHSCQHPILLDTKDDSVAGPLDERFTLKTVAIQEAKAKKQASSDERFTDNS